MKRIENYSLATLRRKLKESESAMSMVEFWKECDGKKNWTSKHFDTGGFSYSIKIARLAPDNEPRRILISAARRSKDGKYLQNRSCSQVIVCSLNLVGGSEKPLRDCGGISESKPISQAAHYSVAP